MMYRHQKRPDSFALRAAAVPCGRRGGKVLVLLALSMPMILGVLGLVIDGSMLMHDYRALQQATDASATAAALEMSRDEPVSWAKTRAIEIVQNYNDFSDASVDVNIPPVTGPYAGEADFAEVVVTRRAGTYFIQAIRNETSQTVVTRAVAGVEPSTAGAAVVVLDPDPPGVSVTGLTISFPAPPTVLGGLEVLGLGQVSVQGAVLVNNEWGGVDENGDPAGNAAPPPYAASCTPLLALTSLRAPDIRVVGGVDNPDNYGSIVAGEPSPLQANKQPVPDPLRSLPVPTVSADPVNVMPDERGTAIVLSIPLLAPPVVFEPGVYEYINVVTGPVVFEPGVYVVRNVDPSTGIAVNITAGPVTADGVMFYVTNNASYSALSGQPDASDGESSPPSPAQSDLVPSIVLNGAVPGSRFSPISHPGSPFDGMLIYQRRADRRPIVVVAEQLLSGASVSGTVYAKWGHFLFTGNGTYDLRVAAGSVRFETVLDCELAPTQLFPPVREVFLVE